MNLIQELLSSEELQKLGWVLLHSLWQFTVIALALGGLLALCRRCSASFRYLLCCLGIALSLLSVSLTYVMLPGAPDVVAANGLAEQEAPFLKVPPLPGNPPGSQKPEFPLSGTDGPRLPENVVSGLPDAVDGGAPVAAPYGESAPADPPATNVVPEPVGQRLKKWIEPWLPAASLIWLFGVFFFAAWNTGGWLGAMRLRRNGVQPAEAALAERVSVLVKKLKVCAPVRVVQSALVEVPVVIGWLRPVLLMPVAMLGGLSPAQMDSVLAHELAHVRRYDYLVNLLQTVVESVLFYHPAIWWMSHRMRVEREFCCDDVAVNTCDGISYASALAKCEELRTVPSPAMAANGGDTVSRVRRILGAAEGGRRVKSLGGVLALVAVLAVAIGCFVEKGGAADGPGDKEEEKEGITEFQVPSEKWHRPGTRSEGDLELLRDGTFKLRNVRYLATGEDPKFIDRLVAGAGTAVGPDGKTLDLRIPDPLPKEAFIIEERVSESEGSWKLLHPKLQLVELKDEDSVRLVRLYKIGGAEPIWGFENVGHYESAPRSPGWIELSEKMFVRVGDLAPFSGEVALEDQLGGGREFPEIGQTVSINTIEQVRKVVPKGWGMYVLADHIVLTFGRKVEGETIAPSGPGFISKADSWNGNWERRVHISIQTAPWVKPEEWHAKMDELQKKKGEMEAEMEDFKDPPRVKPSASGYRPETDEQWAMLERYTDLQQKIHDLPDYFDSSSAVEITESLWQYDHINDESVAEQVEKAVKLIRGHFERYDETVTDAGAGPVEGGRGDFLGALSGSADRIILIAREKGNRPVILETLKGSHEVERDHRVAQLMESALEDLRGGQWVMFLREQSNDGWQGLFPASENPDEWLLEVDGELISRIRESIPLPGKWQGRDGGLSIGLRARNETISNLRDLVVEVALKAGGKLDVWNHRYHIYDYWPFTKFEVTAPDGKRFLLASPAGELEEHDHPGSKSLESGEVYLQSFRLGDWGLYDLDAPHLWRVGRDEWRQQLLLAFSEPGKYTLRAIYEVDHKRGDAMFSGRLESDPVTIELVEPVRHESGLPLTDLGEGSILFEQNGQDDVAAELFAVGEYDREAVPTVRRAYMAKLNGTMPFGAEPIELVGRVPFALYGYGIEVGSKLMVAGYTMKGNVITADIRYVPAKVGAKLRRDTIYFRARLPANLPPGDYRAEFNFLRATADGSLVRVASPLPNLTTGFTVFEPVADVGELERVDVIPRHLMRWGGLFVRDGDDIIDAPEADVTVAKGYPTYADKGKFVDGRRVTIMASKKKYRSGEPVRVIHVLESVKPGDEVYVMGPKEVFGEYVDGELVTEVGPEGAIYDGRVLESPAVDYNYEITEYRFEKPGLHSIQWKADGPFDGEGLESNVLQILVEGEDLPPALTIDDEAKKLGELKAAELARQRAVFEDGTLSNDHRMVALYRIGELATEESQGFLSGVYMEAEAGSGIQLRVIDIIRAHGTTASVPLLEMATRHPGRGGDERWHAALALAKIRGEAAIPRLRELADSDPVATVRNQVIAELARLGDKDSVTSLRRRARMAEGIAIEGLWDSGATEAIPDLIHVCERGEEVRLDLRVRAAYAALHLGGSEAIPFLIDYLGMQNRGELENLGLGNIEDHLKAATRQSFGADEKKWLDWWDEKGRKIPLFVHRVPPDVYSDLVGAVVDWGRAKGLVPKGVCYLQEWENSVRIREAGIRSYSQTDLKFLGKLGNHGAYSVSVHSIRLDGKMAVADLNVAGWPDKVPTWRVMLERVGESWKVSEAGQYYGELPLDGEGWQRGRPIADGAVRAVTGAELKCELELEKDTFATGEAIRISLKLKNVADGKVSIHLGRDPSSFRIRNGKGIEMPYTGPSLTRPPLPIALEAGETSTYDATLHAENYHLVPGSRYQIHFEERRADRSDEPGGPVGYTIKTKPVEFVLEE